MLEKEIIQDILDQFGLTFSEITDFLDTSHGEDDLRWNFILDRRYVLKVNSARSMWEERLQEIQRLIRRYHAIGVYAPELLPALNGKLSVPYEIQRAPCLCFVEEYAIYPVYDWEAEPDRKEIVEHLGLLASRYTGVDLTKTHSMWSIIDLAPLDVDIDEKQENTNTLVKALGENGYPELGAQVSRFNHELRAVILRDFEAMPRCVYQGDLNNSNELYRDGHFAGLIDFNLSGTDVNINVFLNETNWFPDTEALDRMGMEEILKRMNEAQAENLAVIFRHYSMNDLEKRLFPYYQRIVDLFQYPNVCLMVKWLKDESRREKCVDLIRALLDQPL